MKMQHAGWAAAALVLSAPVFAQTGVQSGTGVGVTSGTGVTVTPGVPATTVTAPAAPAATVVTPAPAAATVTPGVSTTVVTPATTMTVAPPQATISGATVAQAGTSETVSGNTKTIITRYWVNVPAGVERDADFQRWMRLK